MTMRRTLPLLLLVSVLGACRPQPPIAPAGPSGVENVVVAPPANKTGGDLTVAMPGFVEKLLDRKKETVPQVLGASLRKQLERQSFNVVPSTTSQAPTLRTEIKRWEMYSADYSMVTVDLSAALVAPDGRELWAFAKDNWRVLTPGVGSAADSTRAAADIVAEQLLATWQPASHPLPPHEDEDEY